MPIAARKTNTTPAWSAVPASKAVASVWVPRSPGSTPARDRPLLDRVMAARGLDDPTQIAAFLDPSLMGLHDPSLIPDLDRAATRLLDAAIAGEPIVIYGDYDVDGATATAILYHTLHAVAPGCTVGCYVPHRVEEGYGINTDAVRELASTGARVIVSVDCGITAIEPAREANSLGIDLIITDHHNPPGSLGEMPEAWAVVHPRRPDSAYPFGELCGAGVAYKLAWRLATLHAGSDRVGPELRTLLVELLALAALGSVADVVPLTGENRIIARHGLGRLKHSPLNGLSELIEVSGLSGESIDAEDVGFRLAPRLNACGRMGHARDTVELLTSAAPERAREIAEALNTLNNQRRTREQRIVEQAIELAHDSGMTGPDRRAIVLAHDQWHPGVVGIACSRLVDRFHRPVVLLCRDPETGLCSGSARSVAGFSVHAALGACAEHLESFGGHDMAAGLKLRSARLDSFVADFIAHANGLIAPGSLAPYHSYDCDATMSDLDPHQIRQLERLAPFGAGNPAVTLRLNRVQIQQIKPFGARGDHLGFTVRDGTRALRVIGWRWSERAGAIRAGMQADLLVRPKLSTWGGTTRTEPELIDLAVP